jgi:hypothetical protein
MEIYPSDARFNGGNLYPIALDRSIESAMRQTMADMSRIEFDRQSKTQIPYYESRNDRERLLAYANSRGLVGYENLSNTALVRLLARPSRHTETLDTVSEDVFVGKEFQNPNQSFYDTRPKPTIQRDLGEEKIIEVGMYDLPTTSTVDTKDSHLFQTKKIKITKPGEKVRVKKPSIATYSVMSLKDLRLVAKKNGIPRYSVYNKEELIKVLRDNKINPLEEIKIYIS